MAEPFATPDHIRSLRTLTDAEAVAAEELIEEASARLRIKVPSIDARLASGQLDPVIPRGIVRRMVIDILINPDGFLSEQVEDAVYRFDMQRVRRQMQPTDDELDDLRPISARKRPRTIHTTPCW